MTTGTIRTQGTELFFLDESNTTSDDELIKVTCATGITGLGGPRDQVESTCLDTVGDKEFMPGLGNPGQVSVPINFIPTAAAHAALLQLKEDGTTLDWMICLSNGTALPTPDSDGGITPPATGRSYFTFSGFVADFNIDIATNEIVRATLTIQRSGSVRFNANGAV